MALLTEKIPQQNFEIVRDRIALILADEISNQSAILPATPDLNPTVWTERFVPFSHVEFPAVNVIFSSGNFVDQYTTHDLAVHKYYIDVYAKSPTIGSDGGDKLASIKLHRMLGICRAILENPQYRTLAFAPPSLQHTKVVDISIEQPQNNQDAESVVMGRLTFDVHVPEKMQLLTANNISGWETSVELNESLKGYEFSNVTV